MTKTLHWADRDSARPLSAVLLYLAAAVLRAGSDVLTRLAVRLTPAEALTPSVRTVEFHALYGEAAAPEGALYVDGKLVGVIEGVTRL